MHPALPDPGRCVVMGVLNVTPDSFSDGGRYLDLDDAVAHGLGLRAQGADLVDVGGESTRPGAQRVEARTEIARVVPVLRELFPTWKDRAVAPDLDRLWAELGVRKVSDAIRLVDSAPLAAIRRAITEPPTQPVPT